MQKNEIGSSFVEQELNENPGVFETYYEIYKSGNYLHFIIFQFETFYKKKVMFFFHFLNLCTKGKIYL